MTKKITVFSANNIGTYSEQIKTYSEMIYLRAYEERMIGAERDGK